MMNARLFLMLAVLTTALLQAQPSVFSSRGIGGGGALFFPTINPANDNEFYVSCDMSEIFHTTDFGQSYEQVHFSKLQVSNTSTYEFTKDANIAYCIFNDGNESYPVKTTDGGQSWKRVSAYNSGTYGDVYRLYANYDNPLQLIVATYGDLLFSADGGASFSLIRHTSNSGTGITLGGVFWDGSDIYLGTNEGLLVSNNGGSNFTIMSTTGLGAGQVIWSFAGSKTGGTKRFVCVAADVVDVYNLVMPWEYYGLAKGVYTMDQTNGIWVTASSGINFSSDYIMYPAMAYNNINTIYLGGNDNNTGGPLIYKSSNGGSSWSKVFKTSGNANIVTAWEGDKGDKGWGWSETCFGMTVARNNSDKVIFSSYSNVQVSSDGGVNWKQAYVSSQDQHAAGAASPKGKTYHSIGLENTTCWQVTWQDADHMIGCFSDIGGIRSSDKGLSWGYTYSGFSVNSLYRICKSTDGKLFGACSNIHDMYQSTRLTDALLDANDANGKIVYSTDQGISWTTLHTFNHPVFWVTADPNNAKRMYASVIHYGGTQGSQSGGIYMTDNLDQLAASTWTKLPNPPRTEGHPACIEVLNDGKVICTFSGRRNSGGSFTASSGVFMYDPVQNSWTDLSNAGMHYWTKDIIIDPTDPAQNTWYVAVFSGWGGAPNGLGGLYKTTNRGSSWVKLTGSQFATVTSITFNPVNIKQAFLTTETQGLWVSDNMDQAQPSWTLVTSYPFRQPERVFFNPYNANEMWVSSFGNGMKMGLMEQASNTVSFEQVSVLDIYPNPSNGQFIIEPGVIMQGASYIEIWDLQGKLCLKKTCNNMDETTVLSLSVPELGSGIYVVKLYTETATYSGKIKIE